MGITFGDHLIDSGYYDITPEQEREIEEEEQRRIEEDAEERRRLENEEMERHFRKHPHG